MGLIERIKAALGLTTRDRTRSGAPRDRESTDSDGSVTVEREPDTGSEDAVKGTETTADSAAEVEPGDATESEGGGDETATEDDELSSEEQESVGETDDGAADEGSEETSEDTGPDETGEDTGADESGEGDGTDEATADDTSEDTQASEGQEDVQSLKGIGPAYAERLGEADIETVGDLAAADAAEVAEETGIAESRVADWIEQAGQ